MAPIWLEKVTHFYRAYCHSLILTSTQPQPNSTELGLTHKWVCTSPHHHHHHHPTTHRARVKKILVRKFFGPKKIWVRKNFRPLGPLFLVEVEFPDGGVGWWFRWWTAIIVSNPNQLGWGCVEVELGLWQLLDDMWTIFALKEAD